MSKKVTSIFIQELQLDCGGVACLLCPNCGDVYLAGRYVIVDSSGEFMVNTIQKRCYCCLAENLVSPFLFYKIEEINTFLSSLENTPIVVDFIKEEQLNLYTLDMDLHRANLDSQTTRQ